MKSLFLLKTDDNHSKDDLGSASLSLKVPGHKEAGLTMKPKAISIQFQAPKPPYKSMLFIMPFITPTRFMALFFTPYNELVIFI